MICIRLMPDSWHLECFSAFSYILEGDMVYNRVILDYAIKTELLLLKYKSIMKY